MRNSAHCRTGKPRLSADARSKLRFMPVPARVADRETFIRDKLKQAKVEPARQEASR
jgi:hypothetical protein